MRVEAPRLDSTPTNAEQEAQALLLIAAEVEGALLVRYLFAAYSLLPGVSVDAPGFAHPILSDDWFDTIRTVAKQEMGHLITVQNLLLSVGGMPHLDRENLPWSGNQLYPFPFGLEPLSLSALAKAVSAEAPRQVATADQADYAEAVKLANGLVGHVSRVGQIYERLYWLFQDGDQPQAPWDGVENPFPDWPNWHVSTNGIRFDQDRQATQSEWRGGGADQPIGRAIYVLPITDKESARRAIFKLASQGEGPGGGGGETHVDKFPAIYREFRAVNRQPNAPSFVRNQAPDPSTGLAGPATITDQTSLCWGRLANVRYQMLLIDISLSLAIGSAGTLPGSSATRSDFISWSFGEMLASVKPISAELRQMPLATGGPPSQPAAGFPFELPDSDLPTGVADQLSYLRGLVDDSRRLRSQMQSTFNPTPKQQGILRVLETQDAVIAQRIGTTPPPV